MDGFEVELVGGADRRRIRPRDRADHFDLEGEDRLAPSATAPTFHSPVAPVELPWLGVAGR
jgi:hypothetical protein